LPQSSASQWHRTDQSDPSLQSSSDLGRFYAVPPEVPLLFGKELSSKEHYNATNYFGPRQWVDRCTTLKETAIMVRDPALYIMECIKHSDLSKPVNKFVLYGKHGCGKSVSLSHLTHFGHSRGMVVLSLGLIKKWMTTYYPTQPSTHTPGAVDHVTNSNVLLKNFRQANAERLAPCTTHRDYVWSVRERTDQGAPLLDVVNLGCERLAFSADALNVLLRELRLNSSEGRIETLVVCDGANSLFSEHTLVHRDKPAREHLVRTPLPQEWVAQCVSVDECSVLKNIKKMLSRPWSGGAVVGSVCKGAVVERTLGKTRWFLEREKDMRPDLADHSLPFQLLGEEGWRSLHPFVPVEVLPYSESELDSHIEYYVERGWISKECSAMAARQEIHFLTGRNPGDFFNFSPSF